MGFKAKKDAPLWKQPQAIEDSAKVMAVIATEAPRSTLDMIFRMPLTERRTELALLHLQRTGAIKYDDRGRHVIKQPLGLGAQVVDEDGRRLLKALGARDQSDTRDWSEVSYGEMSGMIGVSVSRIQDAVRHIMWTGNAPKRQRSERPRSSVEECRLGTAEVGGSIPPVGTRKIHHWPDGKIMDYDTRLFNPIAWCGIRIGISPKTIHECSYFWSKNLDKVTCRGCLNKVDKIRRYKMGNDRYHAGPVEIK